ncbi:diadenosine tetraphosphate hydrolase [Bacillus sp. AFS076308]|uniref:HIT family protein n=1 Tax=unclassified Bacillus (in: firmicutes) TaxID=185979 RepID=UPI000BF98D70|nr:MULTISPECIES: diadenosine tetraphosphate hydrolase [unclassified Bacillus (in: firmicutes)]PFN99654.1 diadenosine tetraphosphate hydrolase [Bacillus sp. AFS076308]PGV50167.1 diadenosine tetraphosphate hydrolase [Bacillus sp. AFS037270]
MRQITLSNGTTVEVECLSCALSSGMVEPDGGVVIETEHFHAHQDVAYPIKGLIILASKRHIYGFDELTEEEKIDYINLLTKIRKAQREVLDIEHVYYFYNEDTTHHFHTWMVPRYEWMNDFGRSVESLRPVLRHARNKMNDQENVNEVIKSISMLTKALREERE